VSGFLFSSEESSLTPRVPNCASPQLCGALSQRQGSALPRRRCVCGACSGALLPLRLLETYGGMCEMRREERETKNPGKHQRGFRKHPDPQHEDPVLPRTGYRFPAPGGPPARRRGGVKTPRPQTGFTRPVSRDPRLREPRSTRSHAGSHSTAGTNQGNEPVPQIHEVFIGGTEAAAL